MVLEMMTVFHSELILGVTGGVIDELMIGVADLRSLGELSH